MNDTPARGRSRGLPALPAWLDLIMRFTLGVTFIYASLDKIAHPAAFAQNIFNYRMVPADLLHPFALLLPWIEAVCGLTLILGIARRGAAAVIGLMNLMFIGAIAYSLMRGLDISCGCFHTEGGHLVGLDLLLRDVALLAMSALLVICPVQRKRLL